MGTAAIGTPVRRRGGGALNNSLAMSSVQGSMALCQQQPSPASSTLLLNQQNNNNTVNAVTPQGGATSSVETLATCPLASLDLSQPQLSRSFDPFPFSEVKRRLKRDARSLEDCATTNVSILPPTPPSPGPLPNGGAVHQHEDEVLPLIPPKRWRSLEDGNGLLDDTPPLQTADAKVTRGSLKSWLVGLLNGNNGLKGNGSQASLRKNVYSLPGTTSSTPGVNFETQTQQFCQANGNDESIV